MTNTGLQIVKTNIEKNLNAAKIKAKYNKSRICKRARAIYLSQSDYDHKSFGDCMREAWADAKTIVIEAREEVVTLLERLSNLTTPAKSFETVDGQIKMHNKMMEGVLQHKKAI